MDINLARTFIDIVSSGSFVNSAKRLNLTQSTISARIRTLEDLLGRQLFVRNRSGATLTPAGKEFYRYSLSLTQIWQQACQNLAVPSGFSSFISVGGQASLWDHLLVDWLAWMRDEQPQTAIRAEYGQPDRLTMRLAEGMLDFGLLYTPETRPGLIVEPLFNEELILVANPINTENDEYVFVDWGAEFRNWHNVRFPDWSSPRLNLVLGAHGIGYIFDKGGSGYFPRRLVSQHLNSGRLREDKKAPTFSLPVFLVRASAHDTPQLTSALAGLRRITAKNFKSSLCEGDPV